MRQRRAAVATASTMRSICSSVMTSGGQNVSVSVLIARVITPLASIVVAHRDGVLIGVQARRPHRTVAAGVVDDAVGGERTQTVPQPLADVRRRGRRDPRGG